MTSNHHSIWNLVSKATFTWCKATVSQGLSSHYNFWTRKVILMTSEVTGFLLLSRKKVYLLKCVEGCGPCVKQAIRELRPILMLNQGSINEEISWVVVFLNEGWPICSVSLYRNNDLWLKFRGKIKWKWKRVHNLWKECLTYLHN